MCLHTKKVNKIIDKYFLIVRIIITILGTQVKSSIFILTKKISAL